MTKGFVHAETGISLSRSLSHLKGEGKERTKLTTRHTDAQHASSLVETRIEQAGLLVGLDGRAGEVAKPLHDSASDVCLPTNDGEEVGRVLVFGRE
jgi:hypothetical protein